MTKFSLSYSRSPCQKARIAVWIKCLEILWFLNYYMACLFPVVVAAVLLFPRCTSMSIFQMAWNKMVSSLSCFYLSSARICTSGVSFLCLPCFCQDRGFVGLVFVLFYAPKIASAFSDHGVIIWLHLQWCYASFIHISQCFQHFWELTWPSLVWLSALTEECIDSWMYFLVDNNNIFHIQASLAEDFHIFPCFL